MAGHGKYLRKSVGRMLAVAEAAHVIEAAKAAARAARPEVLWRGYGGQALSQAQTVRQVGSAQLVGQAVTQQPIPQEAWILHPVAAPAGISTIFITN